MEADIRVMLIGHKPVCAFWRRPVEGEWLTNTSQGGSMDYQDVPKGVLDLAVRASQAANAEYWACDIAVGKDGKFRILECATAFAAFPYIRDWIGQYLMWKLSDGRFVQPHLALYNWEELGKISSNVLRTMRYITFGQQREVVVNDGCETFTEMTSDGYPVEDTRLRRKEEWPSETWNFQDNYHHEPRPYAEHPPQAVEETVETQAVEEGMSEPQTLELPLSESRLLAFLNDVKGIGSKLAENIIDTMGSIGLVNALTNDPQMLTQVKHIKGKKLANIIEHWAVFSKADTAKS
jgi:hypothetical protein